MPVAATRPSAAPKMETFRERVLAAIAGYGKPPAEIAREAKIPLQNIRTWTGKSRPAKWVEGWKLAAFAKVTGVGLHWLGKPLGWYEDEPVDELDAIRRLIMNSELLSPERKRAAALLIGDIFLAQAAEEPPDISRPQRSARS